MSMHVIQYNVFGRTEKLSVDGQRERLERIPEALIANSPNLSIPIDVICFAEVFEEDQLKIMAQKFKELGFPHSTQILSDPKPLRSITNGGVWIVSRWAIVKEEQIVYRNACQYGDCLAAKGVKYARIVKTEKGFSKIFNIFATHLQAWPTEKAHRARVKQANQMREFVIEQNIHPSEPILFAGDFNVDNASNPDEVRKLMDILGSKVPFRIGEEIYTSDPLSNVLVGRDGAASHKGCSKSYLASWGKKENNTYYPSDKTRQPCGEEYCYCPCCPKEWLDYVFHTQARYSQPDEQPTIQAFTNKVQPFIAEWAGSSLLPKWMRGHIQLTDLSDHYPVSSVFMFTVKNKDVEKLRHLTMNK